MGNTSSISSAFSSSPTKGSCVSSGKKRSSKGSQSAAESATERAKKVFGDVHESLKISVKKLEEQDHPAAHLIDTVCGPYFDSHGDGNSRHNRKMRENRSASFYSEDIDSDDDRTISEDEQTLDTDYNASTVNGSTVASSAAPSGKSKKDVPSSMDSSYLSQSDYESEVGNNGHHRSRRKKRDKRRNDDPSMNSDDDESKQTTDNSTGPDRQVQVQLLSKPLASSFAKRCYFTKAGIGKTTQHYEGLTLTGNVVLMLAAAMKLKGCPTICDEDLRRVEQTYPNQFSRLPDELLLSSGWRRISKYCHFSNKPIPDGIPFFHSKQRLHPQGGYYFLLAAAVGMVRPIDVEPLTRDTLVLLETDYPTQCDAAPEILIQNPEEWTLVDKFCFFSGGPINTEEDVYYQADFDGNPIYMLAFLSPSLTPEELYKLETGSDDDQGNHVPGLTSVLAVQEVESVYDLTERDFHDLKLYHLGPCRALPQYILQPQAWTKVLPPHFLEARHRAILLAQEYELQNGGPVTPAPVDHMAGPSQQLTVGATPADARFGEFPINNNLTGPMPLQHPHEHQQHLDHHPHQQPPPYDEQQQAQMEQHPHQHHVGPHPPGSINASGMSSPIPHHPFQVSGMSSPVPHHPHQPRGVSPLPHHHQPGGGSHQQGGAMGQPGPDENGYYIQPTSRPAGMTGAEADGQGFSSEYETMGPHNTAESGMAAYHHPPQHTSPHHLHQQQYQDQQPQHHYHQPHDQHMPPSPHPHQALSPHPQMQQQQQHPHYNPMQSPHDAESQTSQHEYQDEEQSHSRHSSNFQREVEEEGAFVDTQSAPLDEAMAARKAGGPPGITGMNIHQQGMDPPEHLPPETPPDPETETSVVVSEAMSPTAVHNLSANSGSYYSHTQDTLDVSKTDSQYSHDMIASPQHGDAPSVYRGDESAQYSYSVSPDKDDMYYHQDQSRDDQYYDSPDGLKDQPGSQDHEFFNAPSGGPDEDEDYEPGHSSSFDPHGHMGRHPDDHQYSPNVGYYDDEMDSRLELQESSSAEYFRSGHDSSPSPIKMDHLRQLGRKKHESPMRPSAMTSPQSQASTTSISEYSHSSAMRGAQELLKRNRQRRHEQARRRQHAGAEVRVNESVDTDGSPIKSSTQYAFAPDQSYGTASPRGDDGSASTWESGNSEALTSVISGSSVWTDSSSNPADRSSRRALILQMAKARMKSNKERDPAEKTIKEEKSGSIDDADVDYGVDSGSDIPPQGITEVTTAGTDLDFAADLD